MASFHRTEVLGNVGQDPVVQSTASGRMKATFSVAATDKFKNAAGEVVENTTWYRCSVWGRQAEIIEQYVKKGDCLFVEGKMRENKFVGNDGENKKLWELQVDKFQFVGNGGGKKDSDRPAPQRSSSQPTEGYSEDVPF